MGLYIYMLCMILGFNVAALRSNMFGQSSFGQRCSGKFIFLLFLTSILPTRVGHYLHSKPGTEGRIIMRNETRLAKVRFLATIRRSVSLVIDMRALKD